MYVQNVRYSYVHVFTCILFVKDRSEKNLDETDASAKTKCERNIFV